MDEGSSKKLGLYSLFAKKSVDSTFESNSYSSHFSAEEKIDPNPDSEPVIGEDKNIVNPSPEENQINPVEDSSKEEISSPKYMK